MATPHGAWLLPATNSWEASAGTSEPYIKGRHSFMRGFGCALVGLTVGSTRSVNYAISAVTMTIGANLRRYVARPGPRLLFADCQQKPLDFVCDGLQRPLGVVNSPKGSELEENLALTSSTNNGGQGFLLNGNPLNSLVMIQ
jgi:hypothetical protein